MIHNLRLNITDPHPAKLIVGVSGGADSVALLHLLRESGIACVAAHCNFHLRGEESDRDEQFVRKLCKEWNIALEVKQFDTTRIAKEQKKSIEMAARDLRYSWFEELRMSYQADDIAVAHHSDDAVETLILNLLRGTGIRGLSGMSLRNGHIIRPLVESTRSEIEKYLNNRKIEYVNDSSNSESVYTRNKIRLELLPLMEQINPSVRQSLLQTAGRLLETEKVYLSAIEKQKEEVLSFVNETGYISIEKLKKMVSTSALLFEILNPYGFNSATIESIAQSLDSISGKHFLSSEYRVIKDRDQLIITPIPQKETREITIDSPVGKTETSPQLSFRIEDIEGFKFSKEKNIACFDAGKVTFPLTLRPVKQGDSFVPFGMRGRKKLSDYFSDNKYSLLDKEQALVLCCGNDIIWLLGERSDNRYRVDEKTRQILVVEVCSEKKD